MPDELMAQVRPIEILTLEKHIRTLASRVAELEKATYHLPPGMAESYATQIEQFRVEHGRPSLAAHGLRDYATALRSADKTGGT
jgi:hypothetical protein